MLSDEERKAIEEQYKDGLVNLSNVIEPLINQFKIDYSLDIQQCRLIINYLLMEREFNENYYDELDKEIEKLKDIVETLRKENVSLYIERRQEENKIKAKIEEVKEIKNEHSKSFNWADWEDEDVYTEIELWLQSLLEKE